MHMGESPMPRENGDTIEKEHCMIIVTCPNCGAKNRVDEEKTKETQPVCGKCGAKLIVPVGGAPATDGQPVEVSDQNLEQVLKSAGDKPVLVDCWAAWCGPCRMIEPTIKELAKESNGRWVVGKLDVDRNQQTAARYQIDAIPALLLFKNGKLVDKIVGLQPKAAIEGRLKGV
jgi:thioredoxin